MSLIVAILSGLKDGAVSWGVNSAFNAFKKQGPLSVSVRSTDKQGELSKVFGHGFMNLGFNTTSAIIDDLRSQNIDPMAFWTDTPRFLRDDASQAREKLAIQKATLDIGQSLYDAGGCLMKNSVTSWITTNKQFLPKKMKVNGFSFIDPTIPQTETCIGLALIKGLHAMDEAGGGNVSWNAVRNHQHFRSVFDITDANSAISISFPKNKLDQEVVNAIAVGDLVKQISTCKQCVIAVD